MSYVKINEFSREEDKKKVLYGKKEIAEIFSSNFSTFNLYLYLTLIKKTQLQQTTLDFKHDAKQFHWSKDEFYN